MQNKFTQKLISLRWSIFNAKAKNQIVSCTLTNNVMYFTLLISSAHSAKIKPSS